MDNAPELPGLSDLLSNATKAVLDRPGTFLMIWAWTTLPVQLILTGGRVWITSPAQEEFRRTALSNLPFLAVVIPLLLIAGLVQLLGHAAATVAASDALRGVEPDPAGSLRRAADRLPAVIWTAVVVGVRILGASLLLLIPGMILGVLYCLAHYSALLDGRSGGGAAARSWDIVRPFPGKVIGNSVVFSLVSLSAMVGMMGVAVVVGVAFGLSGLKSAAPFAGVALGSLQSLINAWTTAAMTGLYFAVSAGVPAEAPAPAPAA